MTGILAVTPALRVEIDEWGLGDDADITLSEAQALLSTAEQERAAKFVFDVDRDRFVRAHGFLRRRLGSVLGVSPLAVPICGVEGEKPFLMGSNVRFNLSHSMDRAVLAVTHGREVGIDLEVFDRSGLFAEQLEDLADFCLLADERDALRDLPQSRKVARFLSFWTAKEARMKLTGEGLSLEPKAIQLGLREGRAVAYRRPNAPYARLAFVNLSRPDAICCVAVAEGAAS